MVKKGYAGLKIGTSSPPHKNMYILGSKCKNVYIGFSLKNVYADNSCFYTYIRNIQNIQRNLKYFAKYVVG